MRAACAFLILLSCAAQAQVKLPAFQRQVLANGVVVDLLPRRDVPLVTLRVLVKGGRESDPAEMAGLAWVTAELIRRGTAARTADQFSEELDALGATFSTGVDAQSTIITSEFLSKDTDRALDLVADAVLRPAFPEAEVKKVLAQRIDAARATKDSPTAAASLYFRGFLFGAGHPYGRSPMGDELSLARMERKHIVDCHARMFAGWNLIAIAAGDLEPAEMAAKLAKAFGPAPAGKPFAWREDRPPARPGSPRLLLVDKPDATQTYFHIGHSGIRRTHPDRIAVWLVNTLFGGRFTSMLNDELRVNSGLTYGAGSRFDQDRLTGAFAISSYTRTDATAQAVDLALDVLKRLREQGITAEQLASAKAYLKGTFPADRLETADQLAAVLGEMEIFGLSRGEIDDLFARIDAVTPEQANAAAKKYFGSENLTFLLLGNAANIRETAKKYASQIVEVPITKPGFGN